MTYTAAAQLVKQNSNRAQYSNNDNDTTYRQAHRALHPSFSTG